MALKAQSMLVKVTAEMLNLVGATSAAEFPEKFSAFVADSKSMAESKVTLETLQASLTALEGKLISEDRIKAIVGEATGPAATKAIGDWAASEAGKKIIGAEASRITLEALASVGTTPAKPAPASTAGNDTPEQKAAALNAEGKYEEAWKADKNIRAEFPSAKGYAAFMRANRRGQIKIVNRN